MYGNEELELIINEIVDKKVKAILKEKNYETPYNCKVVIVEENDDNTDPYSQYAVVRVIGYNTSVRLRNLSGELLVEGDNVRAYANSSNLSNGYIGVKYNN